MKCVCSVTLKDVNLFKCKDDVTIKGCFTEINGIYVLIETFLKITFKSQDCPLETLFRMMHRAWGLFLPCYFYQWVFS